MELSLLDCDNYLTYKPSIIAASSLFLAAHIVPYNDVKLSDIEKVSIWVAIALTSLCFV